MNRKDEIKSAYKNLGKSHNLYDSMMTGTSVIGRMIDKVVWNMEKDDVDEYQARAFENIPSDFDGKLLEVPVGTGVLSLPVWKLFDKADITCLDYSEKMMESARKRADEMDIHNVSFVQGDVGDLKFEDETFDIVVSLNGFHAFPDKEAAYRETFRVLKKGGLFMGCFYIQGGNKRTDWFIRNLYVKKGFFTPPFETRESLKERLEKMYDEASVSSIEGIGIFCCRKGLD